MYVYRIAKSGVVGSRRSFRAADRSNVLRLRAREREDVNSLMKFASVLKLCMYVVDDG